jgi:hypothetical protein
VNAPVTWRSWGLEGLDGKLKYNPFPPVAFIAMEVGALLPLQGRQHTGCGREGTAGYPAIRGCGPAAPDCQVLLPAACCCLDAHSILQRDNETNQLIFDRIADLKRFNVPADYIMVSLAASQSS